MHLSSKLDDLHARAKANKWFHYFAVFNRIALAAGFIPSGFTKIFGERFTSLSAHHPMGHYLEALFHTGFYYPFIGYVQVTAAILLLIPRTATLGAVLYFPIILNICILSLAVSFDGSMASSPLMVLANLYLLCWDYDKLKFILPFKHQSAFASIPVQDNKFPTTFFLGVVGVIAVVVFTLTNIYTIKPRNTFAECNKQCENSNSAAACLNFCECIHKQGQSYNACLAEFKKSK
jgi:uncharacterized membrane protein YphA (DoxX/SURF4 family)